MGHYLIAAYYEFIRSEIRYRHRHSSTRLSDTTHQQHTPDIRADKHQIKIKSLPTYTLNMHTYIYLQSSESWPAIVVYVDVSGMKRAVVADAGFEYKQQSVCVYHRRPAPIKSGAISFLFFAARLKRLINFGVDPIEPGRARTPRFQDQLWNWLG